MKTRDDLIDYILKNYSYFDYDKQKDFCVFCGGSNHEYNSDFRTVFLIKHKDDCIVLELEKERGDAS